MPHPANAYALIADIGGTNTRVALARGTRLLPESVRRYRNAHFTGLEDVLERFLQEEERPDCYGACVAVAGPVRDGVAKLTNLDWRIDSALLARAARAEKVAILNDLQAQGHALGHIAPDQLRNVVQGSGTTREAGTMLVIGIGTGFNCAPVYLTPSGRVVPPSEAGHASLSMRSDDEQDLLGFIESAHGFPAVEDVLSGRGLERVHLWQTARAGQPAGLKAAEIMAAVGTSDKDATAALAMFVRVMGAETGNLALIHLPFGGIYLAGGVARAVAPWLGEMGFAAAMCDKGRFGGFMRNFPVSVIEDDFAALTGCAHHLDQIAGS